ncbi:MAG: PIN domain-containing protein [Clostridia bacterium]|jgi:predicted nucleic acid-binding protein|nr:PIN domain-containing protein [Clostridia bacterium]
MREISPGVVKKVAARSGKRMSEVIRETLRAYLEEKAGVDYFSIVGIAEGPKDGRTSEEAEEVLKEALRWYWWTPAPFTPWWARLGIYYADRLWVAVGEGVFEVLPLEREDLLLALDIQRKYRDAGFGFVDATCFAVCERHRLRRVFTYDRKHFSLYKPTFAEALELLP